MIQLKIKGYCQNCAEFDPEVETTMYASSLCGEYSVDNYVMCKHHNRCEKIADFIRDEIRRGERNE